MSRTATADKLLLTPRDIRVILLVYTYWGLTTEGIARACWRTPLAAATTCYRRLKQLVQAQYLQARAISAFSAHGTSRLFFTVGRLGLPLVTHYLKLSAAQQRRASRITTPANIAHHTVASHFRLSVELAVARLGHVVVDDWQNESELAKAPVVAVDGGAGNGARGEKVIQNIADRAFTLTVPDQRAFAFLVEIDRDTVTRARLVERLRGYLLHASAQPDQARAVLWVVPHERRQGALLGWAVAEAARLGVAPTLFAIAQERAIGEDTVLQAPIWQVPGLPQPQTVLPRDALGRGVPAVQEDAGALAWRLTGRGRRAA